MTAQDWAIIITCLATALGIREIIPRIITGITGSASRKRSEVDRIAAEVIAERKLRQAESDRADREAANRRVYQEYASKLRAAYYEAGRIPEALPELEDTMPRSEVQRIVKEGS